MSHALQLARRGMYTTHPNPRVGCVIVKHDEIIAEGWHRFTGEAHAEIAALNSAGQLANGADCYVTLEPCVHTGNTPPCTDALIKAGIKRLVAATTDPNPVVSGKGLEALQAAGIITETGLLQQQSQQLNAGFEKRMRYGRPFVRCKLAMSLDGRTAMAEGESKWITTEKARRDVQKFRAQSAAIMTGADTVLADDPALNVREFTDRQPLRVILDRQLRIPADARLLSLPGEIKIFTTSEDGDRKNKLANEQVEIITIKSSSGQDFLKQVVTTLAGRFAINEVLLESGPKLAGNMLTAGLVDEIIIYMAPVLMGHRAQSLFELTGIETMEDKLSLKVMDIRKVGEDIRFIIKPATDG